MYTFLAILWAYGALCTTMWAAHLDSADGPLEFEGSDIFVIPIAMLIGWPILAGFIHISLKDGS